MTTDEKQQNRLQAIVVALIAIREACVAKVFCLHCLQVVDMAREDSCQQCGERYDPTVVGETCPDCGSEHYDAHCEVCDSESIPYVSEVGNIFEWLEPCQREEALANIESFLKGVITKEKL